MQKKQKTLFANTRLNEAQRGEVSEGCEEKGMNKKELKTRPRVSTSLEAQKSWVIYSKFQYPSKSIIVGLVLAR